MVVEKKDSGNYEVGYKKPPQGTQFQKGTSGNPKGRPPGSRRLATFVQKVLGEQIVVKVNGRQTRMSMIEAIIRQLANQAVRGDYRSMHLLLVN